MGVHCIDLVTPTHYTDKIASALSKIKHKLKIPVVWNCGGYEKVETLKTLDGLVDIYLPDFKYASSELGERYSCAPDYTAVAQSALKEMHRQTGRAEFDSDGIMKKGVIVRHLVLPKGRHDSVKVLKKIAEILPVGDIRLSLMSQYTPSFADDSEYDLVCLSNVLNVIQDPAERRRALSKAWKAVKPGGLMLVTVYEADGSGASGPSKDDCWQERRKLNSYIDSELAPYMGTVAYGKLWLSMRKPAPGEKFWPPVGTKATICRMYGGSETPVTVIGKSGQFLLVRECQLVFDGPRHSDTVADGILPGRPGVEGEIELAWKTKGACWHEKGKYGGYVVFGRWSHQPHID
jgi:putative pyruvate formate lyase activating enzyme